MAGTVYRLCARRSADAGPGRTVASVSWGRCEGRHMAGSYGDLTGQAGRGLAGHLRSGTCHRYRHPVDEGCCRRGGVAGAEPPHKGGPNRPDRPNARREWRGERSEKHHFICRQLEWELTMAWVPPGVYESSLSLFTGVLGRDRAGTYSTCAGEAEGDERGGARAGTRGAPTGVGAGDESGVRRLLVTSVFECAGCYAGDGIGHSDRWVDRV